MVPDREAAAQRAREFLDIAADDGTFASAMSTTRQLAADVLALSERLVVLEREREELHAEYKKRYDWAMHERDLAQSQAAQVRRERDEQANHPCPWRSRAEAAEVRVARLEEALRRARPLVFCGEAYDPPRCPACSWDSGPYCIPCVEHDAAKILGEALAGVSVEPQQ